MIGRCDGADHGGTEMGAANIPAVGPATFDPWTVAMVFRIDENSFGETKLDGLKFAP